MDRYQHVVRFSTFGHIHHQSLHTIRAINTTDPIGVYMVTPSGTTFTMGDHLNPSFTVFDFDAEFMVPVNAHVYYMNLTEANETPDVSPKWTELHDLINEYGLADMSPSSMEDFFSRMYSTDGELASLYEWNSARRANPRPAPTLNQIDIKCLVASETYELRECEGKPDFSPLKFLDALIGPWINVEDV